MAAMAATRLIWERKLVIPRASVRAQTGGLSRKKCLPGRTAFSIYRLTERDRRALAWLLGWGSYVLCGALAGGLRWRYYPTMRGGAVTPMTASFFVGYLALCVTPIILDWEEGRRWRRSTSKT